MRDRGAPATTLGGAYLAAPVVTAVLAATSGTHHLGADLAVYVVLAGLLAWRARWWVGLASAALLWLFYDGFLVGQHATLVWSGARDAWSAGLILAGAVAGLLVVRVMEFSAVACSSGPPAPCEACDTDPLALASRAREENEFLAVLEVDLAAIRRKRTIRLRITVICLLAAATLALLGAMLHALLTAGVFDRSPECGSRSQRDCRMTRPGPRPTGTQTWPRAGS
jgi:hypothetical protein